MILILKISFGSAIGCVWPKLYALATPRPRQPDKIMPDGARQKIAGSIWFPGPKIGRKIEGSWPD